MSLSQLRTMVLVHKNLQNSVILGKGFFVGVHIPAPWFANLGMARLIELTDNLWRSKHAVQHFTRFSQIFQDIQYPLVNIHSLRHRTWPIEIVSFPINSMVDLSIVFCYQAGYQVEACGRSKEALLLRCSAFFLTCVEEVLCFALQKSPLIFKMNTGEEENNKIFKINILIKKIRTYKNIDLLLFDRNKN
jgi:hypothetical protein